MHQAALSPALSRLLASLIAVAQLVALGGCGDTLPPPRMAFRASSPTDGAWAFSITDHSGAAQLLLDDRYRGDICRRVGQELRCEIRGLFPGGHTVEVRLPGAVLHRSALIGVPWPKRPLLVEVRSVEQATAAARAGADCLLYTGEDVTLAADLALAAHANGARLAIALPGSAIAATGADAVWARALDPETKRRFPETRELIPHANPQLLAELAAPGEPIAWQRVLDAVGVVQAIDPATVKLAPLGLLAPAGLLVDEKNLDLVKARRKQAALRDGKPTLKLEQPRRAVVEFQLGRHSTLWVANLDPVEEWRFVPDGVAQPLDLLGGSLDGEAIRIRPSDFSLIVRLPGRDPSRL